jgi:nucleoside-diphosphate-sugar epimerase
MDKGAKIYVAGHRGMVGSALVRRLNKAGYENLLLRSHAELDLLDQAAVRSFLQHHRPNYVYVAAARLARPHRPGRRDSHDVRMVSDTERRDCRSVGWETGNRSLAGKRPSVEDYQN